MSECRYVCRMCRESVRAADLEMARVHSDGPTVTYHHRWRSVGAGRGRTGRRRVRETCGPVDTVEVDDYVVQMEHLVGERLI